VTVSTEADLRLAFDTESEVTLANDITLVDCEEGDVDRDAGGTAVVVDGAGFTITQTCPLDSENGVLDVNTNDAITLRNITLTGGATEDAGGGLDAEDGDVVIENSTIVDNVACVDGGGVHADDIITIVASTLSGNFAGAEGGAVEADDGDEAVLTFINSTVTNNSTDEDTAVESDHDLALVYSDVVENEVVSGPPAGCPDEEALAVEPEDADDDVTVGQDGVAANVTASDGFSSFGSVVALALPEVAVNCALENPTDTLGYNYSDDDTCGFTDATDVEDGPDPLLGALAANGGPTLTRLPSADSPLLEQIPEADCGGPDGDITTDQRGEPRPGFALCDIGAVELQPEPPPVIEPIVLEPTFTG
jgi:hypothetical protein